MALIFRIDAKDIDRLTPMFKTLSLDQVRVVLPRVLNDVGDRIYTQTVRAVTTQTGAQQKRVRQVLQKLPAHADKISYSIVARDGFMSLKDFRPRKTKAGVQASPWGETKIFPHSFFGPGGHVYVRASARRLPIRKLWGPAIPREMMRGNSVDVVNATFAEQTPKRLSFWISRVLNDAAKKK